ncbi:hypothetical protein ACFFHH_21555 [Cytobacillus solani]|uniref:hypothetical protein n=1 Tax=Cytobacillus solani TaxID=1637975 RepID=UPI0006ABBE7D|nr:hypothetical protein [Cytobacillus solani]KOP82436.1 hypothetical protein AMS60_08070 [Bacillus sp. FJAT-21945]
MFLEEEIYGMLNWGFGIVMATQLIFFVVLWMNRKFDILSFVYLKIYLVLFTFAGYNLLISINTFEYPTGMGSEKASFNIAIAGILWTFSILFLLLSIFRLVRTRK